MSYETIQYDVDGEIGILTYNRPRVVNAINTLMTTELIEFWRERKNDASVKVIITRGAGEKGFCSGADLKEGEAPWSEGNMIHERLYAMQERFSQVCALMRDCPQPIIAAVHGPAMGGGLCFALAGDIRLASTDAMFCAQYINIGVGGVAMGLSYFLWRIIGWGKAAEMCLTGNRVYAEEALRIGLVNYVYPREELMPAAIRMAEKMVSKNRMPLKLTKEALNSALNGTSLEDAQKMENRNQAFLSMSLLGDRGE